METARTCAKMNVSHCTKVFPEWISQKRSVLRWTEMSSLKDQAMLGTQNDLVEQYFENTTFF